MSSSIIIMLPCWNMVCNPLTRVRRSSISKKASKAHPLSLCSSIIVGKVDGKFQDFDSIMTTYMTFKRAQKSSTPTLCVSAMSTSSGGRHGGAKCGDQEACKKGLPPQSEIDKCTHIEKKRYSKEEYRKFTPAEKAKLWQLYNPGMTPGTGKKTSGKCPADAMDSKIAA